MFDLCRSSGHLFDGNCDPQIVFREEDEILREEIHFLRDGHDILREVPYLFREDAAILRERSEIVREGFRFHRERSELLRYWPCRIAKETRSFAKKREFFAKKLFPIAKKIILNPDENLRMPVVMAFCGTTFVAAHSVGTPVVTCFSLPLNAVASHCHSWVPTTEYTSLDFLRTCDCRYAFGRQRRRTLKPWE